MRIEEDLQKDVIQIRIMQLSLATWLGFLFYDNHEIKTGFIQLSYWLQGYYANIM